VGGWGGGGGGGGGCGVGGGGGGGGGAKLMGDAPQVIYCHKPDICMLNSSEYSMQPLLQLGLRYREIINL